MAFLHTHTSIRTQYSYPAPGSPDLAKRIQQQLQKEGLKSELDEYCGFDHGVFVPVMFMYPKVGKMPLLLAVVFS
jgi:aromatic ring-opening dioxygenase catalytic subunit (LigB family)